MSFKIYQVRPDLEFIKSFEAGKTKLFIKDPVTGTFFSMKFLQYEILKFFRNNPKRASDCSEYFMKKFDVEIEPEQVASFLEGSKSKSFLKIDQHYALSPSSIVNIRMSFKEFLIQHTRKIWEKQKPTDIELRCVAKVFDYIHQNKIYETLHFLEREKNEAPGIELFQKLHYQLSQFIVLSLKSQQGSSDKLTSMMLKEIKSFNPENTLKTLDRYTRVLFSKLGIASFLLVSVVTVYLISYYEKACFLCFQENVLILLQNYWIFMISSPIHTAIHEFGHALTCYRFGGKVTKIGIITFYGLIPTCYADITDSYRMKQHQRILISMAGAGFQLAVGIVCAFLVLFCEKGSFWYNVLWINCAIGVTAPIINYMPGFKNDGYYILTDITRIDNLLSRSFNYCKTRILNFFLGESASYATLSSREKIIFWAYFTLIVFQWTAFVFLSMSMISISWQTMSIIPKIMMLAMFIRAIFFLAEKASAIKFRWKSFSANSIENSAKYKRIWIASALALLLLVPLPFHLKLEAYVATTKETVIRSPVEGHIQNLSVNSDERVRKDSLLCSVKSEALLSEYNKNIWNYFQAKSKLDELLSGPTPGEKKVMLTNLNIQKEEVLQLVGKIQTYETAHQEGLLPLEEMRALREKFENEDKSLTIKGATYQKELSRNKNQVSIAQDEVNLAMLKLNESEKKLKWLNIYAPHDGVIHLDDLTSMIGKHLRQGEAIFTLSGTDEWTIKAFVPETEIEEVQPNQPAVFVTRHGEKVRLVVQETAPTPTSDVSSIATKAFFPSPKQYVVTFKIVSNHPSFHIGESGTLKVSIGWKSTFARVFHKLIENFRVSIWRIF